MKSDAERKIEVIRQIGKAYLQGKQFEDSTIALFIQAMDIFRAEYFERALPIVILENTFPPTIAHLVAIIDRERWPLIDENRYRGDHIDDYLNKAVPRDVFDAWRDEVELAKEQENQDVNQNAN